MRRIALAHCLAACVFATWLPPHAAAEATVTQAPEPRREEGSGRSRAHAEVEAATAALRRAEEALEEGRNVRGGDLLGNVGGGARFTQQYFERVARLERQVEAARERLDRALKALAEAE